MNRMTEGLDFLDATHVRVRGRVLTCFVGSNYVGLGRHPEVLRAMRAALELGTTQPGASRRTTGGHAWYREAERAVARFARMPEAAIVPCGYLAPLAAIHALRAESTHVLVDDRVHACVNDAANASGLPQERFPHGDCAALAVRLRAFGRSARPLVLCEGVQGTRGACAPADQYLRALPRRGRLLVDDAHGFGAVGPGGRGALALLGISDPRVVLTVSLAKGFGVGGGAVLGPREFIENLRRSAAAFVGTTSMPLTVAAGIRAAADVLGREPARAERLRANTRRLHALLPEHPELSNHPDTPVTSVIPATPRRREAMRRALLEAKIFPSFIQYLSGPASGFLRLAMTSEHSSEDVERLALALARGLR
jgi:8-amino-7-oxononanoate synthase